MSQQQNDILQRALKREKAARKQAEKILEAKSTELFNLTHQLKESNFRLKKLVNQKSSELKGVFENLIDAYVIIDIAGNILKMNDSAVTLLELDDVNHKVNLLDLAHPNELDRAVLAFQKLLKTGSLTGFDVHIITKKGVNKLVQINCSAIYKNNKAIAAQGIVRDITDQKASEDKLIESENRLSTLIQNLDSAVLLESEDRKIILTNTKFCDLFNIPISPDLLKGEDCSNAANDSKVLFKNPEEFIQNVATILEEKIPVLGDILTMVDGTILEREFVPILKGNQYKGHLWTYKNVTEAKRNTNLIQEQKKELDVIVNNSSIGIVLTKLGKILKTNKTFQDMLGYSEEEINSFRIKDLSLAGNHSESELNFDRMDAGEIDHFTINERYTRKDGSIIWTKSNVNAVRDNNDKIKYQVALVEDITSKREKGLILDLINNLTKSILGKTDINEIAKEIVNNIAEYLDTEDCVIYLVDHNTGTLEQIASYGDKLDYDRNNGSIVLTIGEGIVGDVVKTRMSEIIKDTSKDDRYIIEDKHRFSEITVPIINEGKVIGIIDSEHKDKNFYTQEHVTTLESIASLVAIKLRTAVSIRERKKAEAQTEQLMKQLEKSNDSLQEYAHIVSHDLKSPLRSINALMSWIKEDNEGKFDKTSMRNFSLIELTLEKMEQLISDILLYSSIDSETLNNQEVDLNLLIDSLKNILFIPSHISIIVRNNLPIVFGERAKLQQLFQNLISNAIKFNDKEKGLIEINVSEKKSVYQFSVKDNGLGIHEKYHDKIFKIFHSLKINKESSGIGLSIVKKIIDFYQGEVWLESELEKGTTFFFTLKKMNESSTISKK